MRIRDGSIAYAALDDYVDVGLRIGADWSRIRGADRRRLGVIARALAAVGLVAVLGWTAQHWLRPSLERSEIRTAIVGHGPLEATVTATGTIVPRTEQTLSSPVSAEITAVHVALGQRVHRGQPIISLDTRASELALRNLEEQLAVKNAEMRSQDLQRADAIRQARSRRALLQIDLESREVRLGRLRRLGESGSVSEADLLEAELDVRRTEVEIEQTDAEIVSLEARREAELERLALDYSILDSQRDDQARRVEQSA